MRFGFVASVVLHVGVVALIVFGALPFNWRPQLQTEPVVPIEILSEAELSERTSVPAMRKKEEEPEKPRPEEKIEPEPKPEPQMKPEPPTPQPKKPEPVPDIAKPKETPKPKPKPKPKPPEDLDLDALSALVDKEKKKTKQTAEAADIPEGERNQQAVGAGDRLTATEEAKMRAAIQRCWQVGALIGAPEPERLVVELEIRLNRDGTLIGAPRTLNSLQIELSGNRFWKAAEQIAQRAVISCAPYDFLSPERYDVWKEMELNFNPQDMAGV